MRGVGGPLLCIGDLLCDVGEADDNPQTQTPTSPCQTHPQPDLQASRLPHLFQESYSQLNEALAGTDHSWTCLTLKLCTALDIAKKLIESANSNATLLLENVGELEKVVNKGDSTLADLRSIHSSLSQRIASSTDSQASSCQILSVNSNNEV